MSVETLYRSMKDRLRDVVPDFELRHKAELAEEINRLKVARNAVVLAHNYMEPALFHSIPDFTGDSLELCRQAAKTEHDIIVFCGVRFMAETAKILNPGKKVLLPAKEDHRSGRSANRRHPCRPGKTGSSPLRGVSGAPARSLSSSRARRGPRRCARLAGSS